MSDPSQIDIEEAIADTTSVFLDGKVELRKGDCRDVLRAIPDSSIDGVVTDPPYALVSIVKRFGGENAAPAKSNGPTGAYARASSGFMGARWDTGETAFAETFWAEVLRVLKPGGHIVAFSGTRTYHRMACAIEDAGFEIRDQIGWCFGSGFPKSRDVSKSIDRAVGAVRERDVVPEKRSKLHGDRPWMNDPNHRFESKIPASASASASASAWDGWGTALKPAWEPICLGRKPLFGTVAANVLEYGVGGLNIDACRVGFESASDMAAAAAQRSVRDQNAGRTAYGDFNNGAASLAPYLENIKKGRWPANLVHDGSDEVLSALPDAGGQQADTSMSAPSPKTAGIYGRMSREGEASADRRYAENDSTNFSALPGARRGDEGSAARFFYSAKADSSDRLGSKHPTVKPIDLMQWLCRMIVPRGGVVLDPFAGTGTTGEAAWREGMRAILIEREPEYQADIARRMELASNPTKRSAVAKTKNNLDDPNNLPLFASTNASDP